MRGTEVRSFSEIAAASLVQPSATARDVHSAVAARVFGLLGPLGAPARLLHDRISAVSYRMTGSALRGPVSAGGRFLARTTPEGRPIRDSALGAHALGAFNGIMGDRLARDHPEVALDLAFRRRGRDVPLETEGLARAYPEATPRLAVFVHGLCETDHAWRLGGRAHPGYGTRLRRELGITPLYVRYNTGLHVSDNGRRLAAALERLTAGWPAEIEEIALIGHSMGGLVSRSSAHYGGRDGHRWTESLRHVICLGTPHLGAPLERAANVADWTLSWLPESRPFAKLFLNRRSAGIKDLRFGNCVEEDWCECDPDEFLRDRCCEVPFLETAMYCFIGATLSRRPNGVGAVIGDLLVHYPSASGAGRSRRIPFELDNGRHVGGVHHLRLLNHPAVYDQIRDWLSLEAPRSRPPATASAGAFASSRTDS